MKKTLFVILLLFSLTDASARHIKGGFFTYKYLGPGLSNPAYLRYKITLTIFMECNPSPGQLNSQINFTIFNSRTLQQVANPLVKISKQYNLVKSKDEQCITGDQRGCYYTIVEYELSSFELPVSADGYTISYQRCCRIEDMDNIISSGDVGNTYTIKIPGNVSQVPDANKNSSPDFFVNDTIVVCQNSFFSYPFKAIDPDGDSLTYTLCNAFEGGAPPPGEAEPNPASAPPYTSVPYKSPYNSTSPLGAKVSINTVTGLISGIAPPIGGTGEYVVTVCVSEYRNGIYFADSRKELHVRVKDCSSLNPKLNPIPVTCDGFNINFANYSPLGNPSGTDYAWNFGDSASGISNTSISATPNHSYTDTGIFTIKLKVSVGGLCADSTTAKVKVYPGFFPGFKTGPTLCQGQPVQFIDTTKTNYGTVTGWRWNFANPSVTNDTSHLSNPTYLYPKAGVYKNVEFIVANTFGCIDTVYKDITIQDPPPLQISGSTLICWLDTTQLTATGNGSLSWSPNYMIDNVNSKTPLISPDVSTEYIATLTDLNGCRNTDSIFINVKTAITVQANNDTTICKTDAITLHTTSEGLTFSWSPVTGLNDATLKEPVATPLVTTTYRVVANLGRCQDEDAVTITVVPYPAQQKAKDITVCFPLSTQISASGGSMYSWTPTTFLSAANIPSPSVISPTQTTQYIATVTDILGCPKPVYDTVLVIVEKLNVDAGPRDTAIVLGEPLYLHASPANIYSWSPSKGLDNPTSQNPIAKITENAQYILFEQTTAGCKGTDTINIKVYRVPADLYVPTAFSPNGDGLNDVFRPILLGVRKLNAFYVYNRWGQIVYSTDSFGHSIGWDGTFNGNPQAPGTYVWRAEGISYEGKALVQKGYVVLIR